MLACRCPTCNQVVVDPVIINRIVRLPGRTIIVVESLSALPHFPVGDMVSLIASMESVPYPSEVAPVFEDNRVFFRYMRCVSSLMERVARHAWLLGKRTCSSTVLSLLGFMFPRVPAELSGCIDASAARPSLRRRPRMWSRPMQQMAMHRKVYW